MPAPGVRSSSSATGQTGATFSVTKPAGVQAGDLLLAFQATSLQGGAPPAAPSGWTQQDSLSFASLSGQLQCFYKVAGSSEPASYTFNGTGFGLAIADVWLLALSGAASAPEGDTTNTGNGSTATASTYTTQAVNELIVCAFAALANDTFTPQMSLTDLGSLTNNNVSLDAAYQAQASAGATGNLTAALTSANWAAMLVAVPPAAVASGPGPLLFLVVRPSVNPALFE